jgi:moderate conductance mechanosensitive channel
MADSTQILGLHLLPDPQKMLEISAHIGVTILFAFLTQRALFLVWGRVAALMTRHAAENRAQQRRAKTITRILRNLTTAMVTMFAVVHSLELLGWNVMPLFAGAGLLGVALGFGAQTLVRDWIAGVFIIAENQYDVGDVIEINGRTATVEDLKFRSTRLRDANGYVLYVPNGEMKIIVNRSRGWNLLLVDISVRAGEDLERALGVCRDVAAAMSADPEWKDRLLEPARLWGVERVGADVVMRLSVKGLPGAPTAEAARELRRRLHEALNLAGVRYPQPATNPDAAAVAATT